VWLARVGDAIMEFGDEGPGKQRMLLPDSPLAVGVSARSAAVVTTEGTIFVLDATGTRVGHRRVRLPDDLEQLAVSPDGERLAAVIRQPSHDDPVRLETWHADRWSRAAEPDYFVAVTSMRFDDAGWLGYAWLTGQPWSSYGSYGSRRYGAAVLDDTGTPRMETWDTRTHDWAPRFELAWTADALVSVEYLDDECGEIAAYARRDPADANAHDWWDTPLGGPELDEGLIAAVGAPRVVELAHDGRVAGVLSEAGELALFDTTTGARVELGPADAFDLSRPDTLRVALDDHARCVATTTLDWMLPSGP
jgi:hypothetical protein